MLKEPASPLAAATAQFLLTDMAKHLRQPRTADVVLYTDDGSTFYPALVLQPSNGTYPATEVQPADLVVFTGDSTDEHITVPFSGESAPNSWRFRHQWVGSGGPTADELKALHLPQQWAWLAAMTASEADAHAEDPEIGTWRDRFRGEVARVVHAEMQRQGIPTGAGLNEVVGDVAREAVKEAVEESNLARIVRDQVRLLLRGGPVGVSELVRAEVRESFGARVDDPSVLANKVNEQVAESLAAQLAPDADPHGTELQRLVRKSMNDWLAAETSGNLGCRVHALVDSRLQSRREELREDARKAARKEYEQLASIPGVLSNLVDAAIARNFASRGLDAPPPAVPTPPKEPSYATYARIDAARLRDGERVLVRGPDGTAWTDNLGIKLTALADGNTRAEATEVTDMRALASTEGDALRLLAGALQARLQACEEALSRAHSAFGLSLEHLRELDESPVRFDAINAGRLKAIGTEIGEHQLSALGEYRLPSPSQATQRWLAGRRQRHEVLVGKAPPPPTTPAAPRSAYEEALQIAQKAGRARIREAMVRAVARCGAIEVFTSQAFADAMRELGEGDVNTGNVVRAILMSRDDVTPTHSGGVAGTAAEQWRILHLKGGEPKPTGQATGEVKTTEAVGLDEKGIRTTLTFDGNTPRWGADALAAGVSVGADGHPTDVAALRALCGALAEFVRGHASTIDAQRVIMREARDVLVAMIRAEVPPVGKPRGRVDSTALHELEVVADSLRERYPGEPPAVGAFTIKRPRDEAAASAAQAATLANGGSVSGPFAFDAFRAAYYAKTSRMPHREDATELLRGLHEVTCDGGIWHRRNPLES